MRIQLALTAALLASPAHAAGEASTLLRGGHVLVGDGTELAMGDVLLKGGKLAAIGAHLDAPAGARVVELHGRYVTPGVIDTHSHLGVYPSPSLDATSDGNEMTDPTTPGIRTEHAIWPQ